MKTLKNVVLSVLFAVATVGVSTAAIASENSNQAEVVVKKIGEAKAAIVAGKPNAEISTLISEAKKESKNIHADDKMASKIQRAAQHLAKAIGALKQSDAQLATDHLTDGEKAFTELKSSL
jgi:predicted Zn-dependent protease